MPHLEHGSSSHNQKTCPGWPLAESENERVPKQRYGLIADADNLIYLADERMWLLDNGEYDGVVFFCPWCGARLNEDGTVTDIDPKPHPAVRHFLPSDPRRLP